MLQFLSLRNLGLAAATLVVVLALGSCSQSPSAPGTGSLSVFMAFDHGFTAASPTQGIAPLGEDGSGWGDRTPLSDLIVSFHSVEAWSCADDDTSMEEGDDEAMHLEPLHDGEDDDDNDEEGDDECQSFGVMSDSTVTVSVSGLDTTLTALLGSSSLPAGDYDFLVLGIVDAYVVTQAGDTMEAKVPSGHIKVKSPFSIREGGSTEILIVFDVNRSVVEIPPGSMNFLVKPVLHSHVGWDGQNDGDNHDDGADHDDGDTDD
jgi:hypothetical protein